MALSGVTVTCGQSGGEGNNRTKQAVFGFANWQESPASGVASTNSAPGGDTSYNIFRCYASSDAWISIGPSPNASASPRHFLPAGTIVDLYASAGDKFAWVLDT